MKMPTTINKVEAKLASPELGDAAKQCINCLEKKVRNLEKRKGRIEQNQEKAKKGTKLEKEQEVSLNQYEQVSHDLEFARELHKQFVQIYTEHEKMSKKQAKREKVERQTIEIKRISEILQLQSLLDLLGGDKVREDFKTGKHGAVVLTEDNLNQLDELYQAISPSRDDSGDEYPQKLTTAAEHLVNILEGKDRQVVGTTYKEIKELITLINGCGYFERAKKPVTDEVVAEPNEENEEFQDTIEEPSLDDDLPSNNGHDLVTEQSQQQPIDLTIGNSDGTQPQRDLPAQPLNTLEQDAFFAPSSTSYQANTESQFSQPSHTAVPRVPDYQSFTNNRPFQFIQASYVMPDSSVSVVVDPAVIAAQPAGASGLQFMSQGFDAVPVVQALPQQKQQDLSHSTVNMQQHQQTAADYNSPNYAQAGLQQVGANSCFLDYYLYTAQGVDESNQLSSHPGIIGHIGDDNVGPYEIPPTIPMPPSQSQDQSQLDQQQQQQEKKFQMNASAPGQPVPVSAPPPTSAVADQQVSTPASEFTNTSAPSGDYGQQGTDFQQNYQGNNGFQNYRGRPGFRGRGNGGNRGTAAAGNPVQNGFGGRGGSAPNTNNSRGGRGGSYQGYPPNNNYRPDSFQGGYNSGAGFTGGNYQKRGALNAGSQSGGSYSRGGATGNARGATGAVRGGGGAPRGTSGSAAPRGSPRGGFNRPQPAQ
ncbi:unnamed protein product [Lymnaea stagnalis]|uniref:Caprin-1 dimerization domain-containing protein n=1 Tax=Lymnaea stagnalis TaxID=6523 RepID=A0AAV2IIE0_LYMST